MSELSCLLQQWSDGSTESRERAFQLCYQELRRIAKRVWSKERNAFTLQPTEIVNEAFLRLTGLANFRWQGSGHFYALFSRAMRRAVIDHCRAAKAAKRPRLNNALNVESVQLLFSADQDRLLDLSLALEAFAEVDPLRAEVVSLHFLFGFTFQEVGQFVGKSEDAVKKDWSVAKLWLVRYLRGTSALEEGARP